MKPQIQTGRVCAICGKRQSPKSRQRDTYGFHSTLTRHGLKGDKAHRECVAALGRTSPAASELSANR